MGAGLIEELPERIEKALKENLVDGEEVLLKLKGAFKEGLICTSRRVMIIKGGFMTGQIFGNNVFQLPYQNVAGVEVKFSLLTGFFELSAGGMQNTTKSYWSNEKGSDAKSAPNCVSISGKTMADAFKKASAFILEKAHAAQTPSAAPAASAPVSAGDDIIGTIERLAKLRDAGAITVEEFESKKKDLLARL